MPISMDFNFTKNQFTDYVVNKATPFVSDITKKINEVQKWFHPIFHKECEKLGSQLAKFINKPEISHLITTALKILPITLLVFTVGCFVNTPVSLLIGALTAVVILTQDRLLSSEGKKSVLQGYACASALNAVCKVAVAVSQLNIITLIGSIIVGGCLTVGFYIASTL